MGKELHMSKPFAVMAVAMTVSAVTGIITMIILYQIQITPLNPTPRPTPLPTTTLPTGPPPSMRLPGNLVPKSYQLYFQPHLYSSIDLSDVNATEQNLTFTGNSTVVFQCVQKTKSIFLHSNNLTLLELYVTNVDTKKIVPHLDYKEYDDGTHFLEVQMTDALTDGGNYSLFVAFQGEIQDDLSGMYVSTYNEDGLKKYVVATQLEPTDARKMFPCFDEPALKATFDVTIIHRLDTTALGNWDKKLDLKNIIDDEWKYTRFNPTKLMSTYLLAFAVSEFPFTSGDPTSRVDIKTYARKDAIEAGQADYAVGITGKLLKTYEEHFGINYVLPKLDQFVVPDHRAAAMENWGLIMYQESSMLYDKKKTSLLQKDWIADVVAHELAHQWFGNLVTMRWWNDVWLNEGFSSYMANRAVAQVEPDWNMKEILEMHQRQDAFEIDALNSSHPLSPPANQIQTTGEIGEMFSTITYLKGAAVLTMLAGYLTERVFDAGIKMYLKEFEFKNTETQDVWNSMQKAVDEAHLSGINVTEMMNTWTKQIGFPVVTINTTEGEAYQKQFTLSPATEAGRVWHIPMRVMSKTSGPLPVVLNSDRPVHKDEFRSKKGEWILVNATGYFRVNYNPENWRRLLDQLEMDYTVIAVMERGQLIDDAFNLARAKLVNITLALNTTRFLQNDTEYLTWEVTIKNLNYFVDMFDRSIVYGPMQVYMRNLVCPLYTFFQNYTDNSSIPTDRSQQENQVNVINMACSNGLPACQKMARTMFRQWMNNETNNRINPNLRSAIYCQAVAAGGDKEWEFAWKMYKNATIDQERDLLTHALSCTNKIWLLSRLLEYTLDPEKIRKSDVLEIIAAVGSNAVGQSLAWNFLRSHWLVLRNDDRLGPSYVLKDLARRFSTEVELQELKQFQMAENAMESRLMNQAIEQTEANIQWVKENKQTVLNWFMANLSPGNSTPCYLETFV